MKKSFETCLCIGTRLYHDRSDVIPDDDWFPYFWTSPRIHFFYNGKPPPDGVTITWKVNDPNGVHILNGDIMGLKWWNAFVESWCTRHDYTYQPLNCVDDYPLAAFITQGLAYHGIYFELNNQILLSRQTLQRQCSMQVKIYEECEGYYERPRIHFTPLPEHLKAQFWADLSEAHVL
jgi:hypothetical protein